MKKSTLILWDTAFIVGVMVYFFWDVTPHYKLIIGLTMVNIFINSALKHKAFYNLYGKIY
jgi:hypothetical protein